MCSSSTMLSRLVEKAERLMERANAEDRDDLVDGIEAVRNALAKGDSEGLDGAAAQLADLIYYLEAERGVLMKRYPNCRAQRAGEETCRRCGMDLAPLLAVERAAESLISRAVGELVAGEIQTAVHTLANAGGLSAAPLIGRLSRLARSLREVPSRPDDVESGPNTDS